MLYEIVFEVCILFVLFVVLCMSLDWARRPFSKRLDKRRKKKGRRPSAKRPPNPNPDYKPPIGTNDERNDHHV